MIVSHEHRFIFLKTRKTAGTSVEIALSRICGPDDIITPITETDEQLRKAAGGRPPQHYTAPPLEIEGRAHMPASAVRRIVGTDVWESYFKFAIERNPWDAVVSLYYWRNRDNPTPVPLRNSSTPTKCLAGRTRMRGFIDCRARSQWTNCVASSRWTVT